MPRLIDDLSRRQWRFGEVERQPLTSTPGDDRSTIASWWPATVPGDTRADLVVAGRLPAGVSPEDLRQSAWVDDRDWWYKVTLDPVGAGHSQVLEADGIDYLSSLWLNDRCLASHEGMFGRQTVVLPSGTGARELAVRIWGSGALRKGSNPAWRRAARFLLARAALGTEYFPDRLSVTKAQFGFGWDFAPRVLACGIWDDIRVITVRGHTWKTFTPWRSRWTTDRTRRACGGISDSLSAAFRARVAAARLPPTYRSASSATARPFALAARFP